MEAEMAQQTWTDFVVRYVDEAGRTKEKKFKTADKRAAWLDGAGEGVEILAFSDPQ